MTKKTGGLHLRRDGAHGVVWLTTGALTGGASDVNRQALARRLIGSGQVSDESLQAAIDQATSDDTVGVARALQQAAALDEGVLHDLVSEHIVDTVFDLLRWPDGEFSFSVDEGNPDDVGVSRQVDDIVAEARRRLESWGTVAATIPSPQTVLSLAANPPDDPHLSRDEWAMLALIDGQRTVGEVVTPKRPEPFLPKRQPEHPEPIPAAVAATAGGAATAAAPSPLIERDPSVNKSLLLRLIAGVRGL